MMNIASNISLASLPHLNPLPTLTAWPATVTARFTSAGESLSELVPSREAVTSGLWSAWEQAAGWAAQATDAQTMIRVPAFGEFGNLLNDSGLLCAGIALSVGGFLAGLILQTEHRLIMRGTDLLASSNKRVPSGSEASTALLERYSGSSDPSEIPNSFQIEEFPKLGFTEEGLIDAVARLQEKRDLAVALATKKTQLESGAFMVKWHETEREYGRLLEKVRSPENSFGETFSAELLRNTEKWGEIAKSLA